MFYTRAEVRHEFAMTGKPTHADRIQRIAQERGNVVRMEREARGWSQAELASLAGTNQQTVDRIERGVTANSKAYPAIRDALGLDKSLRNFNNIDQEMDGRPVPPRPPNFKALDKVGGGAYLPVYQVAGEVELVDAVPRMFPVQFVENAFAVIVQTSDMAPAYNPGDLAVVNPNLPALPGCDVILGWQKTDGPRLRIKHLVRETDDGWVLKSWRPEREDTFSKSEYPKHEVIVARISRYR